MKSVDNEEETEQVVLELFMCVVVLYQGSSFREISYSKIFCHELTDCRRSNTVNWIMKLIWMRITCYLKISSSLSKYCTLYSILFRMKSLLIADFYTSESHTWAHWMILLTILHNVAFLFKLKEEVKKLQSIQQAKSGVDIVSEIRVKTHYATPIGADQRIGQYLSSIFNYYSFLLMMRFSFEVY
ncbi:uncharacterized protein [Solanum tuberosum]|nr:PREDICTED: uncharacterized protein LOC102586144 isoform X1 [Solanum tuberosum]